MTTKKVIINPTETCLKASLYVKTVLLAEELMFYIYTLFMNDINLVIFGVLMMF